MHDIFCCLTKPRFSWHRSQGLGLLQIASRIGSAGAPWIATGLRTVHASLPFIVMGGSSFIAVAMLFYLPETKGVKIAETLGDKEDEGKELLAGTAQLLG